MTRSRIHRDVARATGEDISTIRRLGFQVVKPERMFDEPDSDADELDLPPSIVNWDELASQRVSYLPQRQRMAA
ncbi:MAG: hypothetical protein AB7O62_15160 [Pirellulales bacterium]